MNYSRNIVLNVIDDFRFILVACNEEESDEIAELAKGGVIEHEKYPFLANVHCVGHVSQITEGSVDEYVPIYKTRKYKKDYAFSNTYLYSHEYKCYAKQERDPYSTVIIHEDKSSAFRGACLCLHAHYFVVFKLPLPQLNICEEWKSKKTINNLIEENESNQNRDTSICEEAQGE